MGLSCGDGRGSAPGFRSCTSGSRFRVASSRPLIAPIATFAALQRVFTFTTVSTPPTRQS